MVVEFFSLIFATSRFSFQYFFHEVCFGRYLHVCHHVSNMLNLWSLVVYFRCEVRLIDFLSAGYIAARLGLLIRGCGDSSSL
jgi:sterol desaturase/sphingolipid hydroxylase (fatty acid hydroxylase superfamily)